ncbi:hypothetical protein [Mangrovimonas sp. YM274]|uniref:hypothetical protein n=1 Tax=Mangrovimonas sp. YM274 TaxID=3070660 RepID=UPI0027DB1BF8|nr:hypothetical protein [Mangrovimonas sp. YM274]WMI70133.1 hypothetical protein RBH95_07225 [Mangrovimonas sp. YM274]
MKKSTGLVLGVLAISNVFTSCSDDDASNGTPSQVDKTFTIAVIPDTQNMTDFTHQTSYQNNEGVNFPIDAYTQFYDMMQYVSNNAVTQGGEIAFLTSVGDIWQHQTEIVDAEHEARGFSHDPYSLISYSGEVFPTEETLNFEMPLAREGYEMVAQTGIPFGVAPGNHDSDAMWSEASFESDPSLVDQIGTLGVIPEILGMLHIGGWDNFNAVFGENSDFFKNKPWYVSSFNGGANSAQTFEGAGYTFLNISLEMQPSDDVLAWAQSVIDTHPGLPTIITTHDFLDANGERLPNPIVDLPRIDPEYHNSAEDVFQTLVMPNDQIFLILSGHHHGKAMRVDQNNSGHAVIQVLADYQDRGQSVLDADPTFLTSHGTPYGIGDGWLRLMNFNFEDETPFIEVKTYSSHYQKFSDDVATYSEWYKASENPEVSDSEFHALDSYTIELSDFKNRFSVN